MDWFLQVGEYEAREDIGRDEERIDAEEDVVVERLVRDDFQEEDDVDREEENKPRAGVGKEFFARGRQRNYFSRVAVWACSPSPSHA